MVPLEGAVKMANPHLGRLFTSSRVKAPLPSYRGHLRTPSGGVLCKRRTSSGVEFSLLQREDITCRPCRGNTRVPFAPEEHPAQGALQ